MDFRRKLDLPEQQAAMRTLRSGLERARLTPGELGLAAMALDGALTPDDVHAVLAGSRRCTAHEHDVLAQALNDHFTEHGENHPVHYSDDLGRPG